MKVSETPLQLLTWKSVYEEPYLRSSLPRISTTSAHLKQGQLCQNWYFDQCQDINLGRIHEDIRQKRLGPKSFRLLYLVDSKYQKQIETALDPMAQICADCKLNPPELQVMCMHPQDSSSMVLLVEHDPQWLHCSLTTSFLLHASRDCFIREPIGTGALWACLPKKTIKKFIEKLPLLFNEPIANWSGASHTDDVISWSDHGVKNYLYRAERHLSLGTQQFEWCVKHVNAA